MIPSAAIPMIAIQSSLKTGHGHASTAKVRIASLNIIIHSAIASETRRKANGPTERAAFFIIDDIPGVVPARAAPFSLSTALRDALAGMTEPRSDFAVV